MTQIISPSSALSIDQDITGEVPDFKFDNPTVARLETPATGVHFFEAKDPVDAEVLILSAGLHGDELAGLRILDTLRQQICSGKIELKKNVLFIDGNLKAMHQAISGMVKGVPAEARYWKGDKDYGMEANANRMWVWEELDLSREYESFAGQRRQIIWQAINDILLGGSGTAEVQAAVQHHDIHQSFKVPTVKAVRGNYHDDSEYTYGMAYGSDEFFSQRFGTVFAGLVQSDPLVAQTFAGITAREFRAKSITAELGSITSRDEVTYAHKLLEALVRELEGVSPFVCETPPDIWRQLEPIIREREVDRFGFYDVVGRNGFPPTNLGCNILVSKDNRGYDVGSITEPPEDFVPLQTSVYVNNGDKSFYLPQGESVLFANAQVVEGDRAGVLIERVKE